MKTVRELMTEKPLKFFGLGHRPEWTVSIRSGLQGFRLLVVDAKTGSTVTETGIRRLEGALVAEALHLAAEAEGTIPALINCGRELCFRHMAFELWAVHHTVTVRFGKPLSRYAAYKNASGVRCCSRLSLKHLVEEPPRAPAEATCQTGLGAIRRGGRKPVGKRRRQAPIAPERRNCFVQSYLRNGVCPIGVPVRTFRRWVAEYRKSSLPNDLGRPQDKEAKSQ